MHLIQPALFPIINVSKCCNEGEYFYFSQTGKQCRKNESSFEFHIIYAEFYRGCIEDKEVSLNYRLVQKTPCNG